MDPVRRPSLVVFDLDDTLYPYEPAHRAGTAALTAHGVAELRIDATRLSEALASARDRVKARLGASGPSHSRLLYIHDALELLGFRSQPSLTLALEQEYWRAYLLAMELRPGAEELLALLRYNSIPVAVVTDLTMRIQLRKLVHLRLDSLVDHVVVSSETSGDKVTLAPFRLLADRVPPELLSHVWFIGDGPQDAPVAALLEAGLIESGTGWIHGGAPGAHAWRSFPEIGNALDRSSA